MFAPDGRVSTMYVFNSTTLSAAGTKRIAECATWVTRETGVPTNHKGRAPPHLVGAARTESEARVLSMPVLLSEQSVRINDEFLCDAAIELGIPLRCLIQRDDLDIDSFGDVNSVVKNRHHQCAIVFH